MKTKLIGYGIVLATFSNIIEAEPKDGEDVAQPSEAARFIAEVLQVQLRPNFIDVTLPWNYELNVLLTERQILALKYLCTQLGPQFGCDSIYPHTPLAKDLAALCDDYNPDSHYDFLLREPAPIHQDAFFREVIKSLSEKVKQQEEQIAILSQEIEKGKAKTLEAEKKAEEQSRTNVALQDEKESLEQEKNRVESRVLVLQKDKKDFKIKVKILEEEKNKAEEVNKKLTVEKQQAEQKIAILQSKSKMLTKAEEDAIIRERINNSGGSLQQKDSIKRILKL